MAEHPAYPKEYINKEAHNALGFGVCLVLPGIKFISTGEPAYTAINPMRKFNIDINLPLLYKDHVLVHELAHAYHWFFWPVKTLKCFFFYPERLEAIAIFATMRYCVKQNPKKPGMVGDMYKNAGKVYKKALKIVVNYDLVTDFHTVAEKIIHGE